MKIVFDGGAFQQGIAGGILNVAINFLNAAVEVSPNFSFVLLADPLFGEVRPEFLEKLTVKPEIVFRQVLKRTKPLTKLVTHRMALQVLIDGQPCPFEEVENRIEFHGEMTPHSIEILSRASRPCDIGEAYTDGRLLGLSFSQVRIATRDVWSTYYFDDPRFDEGNYSAEAELRWTSGSLSIPQSMLPTHGPWRVHVLLCHRMIYAPFGDYFDNIMNKITTHTRELERNHELARLAEDMRRIGAQCYFANHFLPVCLPGLPLFSWAYDIVPLVHPEYFDKDARDNFAEVVNVLMTADSAFCISQFTKRSILEHLDIDERRLHVSWIGASPEIHRRSEEEVVALRTLYSLPRPYIVCVATIEPRKNHVALIEAYDLLLKAMPDAPDLVLAGKRGWGYNAFFDKLRALGLSEHVHHLEHLSDCEIASLYSGAEMCVYPSLFEGFGLPVLEAMRCGIPVVTSRNTSMEEILGEGGGILINPTNPQSIAKAMQLILSDEKRRSILLAKSADRLSIFDWQPIARSVLAVMEARLR